MAERFEIEQREEWSVVRDDGNRIWLAEPEEWRAREIAQGPGYRPEHRTVYVWTGEWKPAPEPHTCEYVEADGTTAGACHLPGPHGGRRGEA